MTFLHEIKKIGVLGVEMLWYESLFYSIAALYGGVKCKSCLAINRYGEGALVRAFCIKKSVYCLLLQEKI